MVHQYWWVLFFGYFFCVRSYWCGFLTVNFSKFYSLIFAVIFFIPRCMSCFFVKYYATNTDLHGKSVKTGKCTLLINNSTPIFLISFICLRGNYLFVLLFQLDRPPSCITDNYRSSFWQKWMSNLNLHNVV